jgi:hypothetical protein
VFIDAWIEDHARRVLGAFGRDAEIFNVYSVGDSGEGCEVIEFTTPWLDGSVPWTARTSFENGSWTTACTCGWVDRAVTP